MIIRTPDQRLRVFVSSTLQELADERAAAREAISRLRLSPVMFELGARPHPPQELYRAYLDQSHIFVGIYWERYGWVAPDMDISGLEDEYRLCGPKPKLIYLKTPAPNREPRLKALLDRIRNDDTASYKSFTTAAELQQLIENDLAILLTERFEMTQASSASATDASQASAPAATMGRIYNLPTPSTPLIGREQEIAQISDTLLRSDVRLVTLFGPGGIGKTRLAIEVGRNVAGEFSDGVCFVSLSNVSDHNLVVPAIGEALGLGETRSAGLAERVTAMLRDKHALLILDNFEQVMPAAPLIADLLAAAPQLELIVTSRSVLRVRGEFECAVQPLALPQAHSNAPPQPDELRKSPAVQLFEARAQAVKPSFEITRENAAAVAELCARLDGLPLAIELAAARVKLLSPQAILSRMIESERESLRLLSGGARDLPVRQQTLQNTLDWSYGLLEPSEQLLFARLSAFDNGWTLESAVGVCGFDSDELAVMDTLASLNDKSLITRANDASGGRDARSADGDERFTMLNIIREYAAMRLEASGEAPVVHRRHAEHFMSFARRARPELRSANQRAWLARLERDNGNLQSALNWLIESGDSEAAAEFCWSLAPYWLIASRMSEAMRWTTAALSRLDVTPSPDGSKPLPACVQARAKALAVAGFSAAWQGNPDWAMFLLSEAEALTARASNDHVNAMINAGAGIAAMSQSDFAAARARFEKAFELYMRMGDTWAAAMALNGIERLAVREGDYATSERVHQDSQRLSQSVGDKVTAAMSAYALGQMALLQQDATRAGALFRESLQLSHHAGYREGVAYGLEGLAAVANLGHDSARASQLLGAAQAMRDKMGAPVWQSESPAHERLVSEVRAQAGSSFEQAWAQGAAMTLEQAMGVALSEERAVSA